MMGSEAFDRLLSRLDTEDRERIHEMAMAYGLTFDDPSWVPFAITQVTMDELKAQVEDAADEIEKAADLALRKVGNSARVVSNQARTVIEAQSRAVQGLRDTILDIERASAIEYRKLLTELAAQQIGKFIEKGTNGIVQDVTRQLTGKDGMLAHSAIEHAAELEQARQRFVVSVDAAVTKVEDAARKAAASTRRGVRRTVFLAMGTIAVYAVVTFGLLAFWSGHQPTADVHASGTCSASQRSARPPAW
ncbi:hypothetical protein BCh11DRAFT_04419 [Burkholderia sp. Ch1-1]|nr:hypothetical protein BCh11DRAFT_04419 [Burkholderia sp. Ch1-1]